MTDLPYTDDDLRSEAAAQHYALTEDPDYAGVGEAMEDDIVPSTEAAGATRTWDSVLRQHADDYQQFVAVQRHIHELITGAADTSRWAIDLGADGLKPDRHSLQLGVDPGDGDRPRVRLHFAFAPDMEDTERDRFVMRLSKAIVDNL